MTDVTIMLRGLGGCGKSTIADIISSRTGWPVRKNIQRLVDGLYEMGITKGACPELYRACADFIGDAARQVDPMWWVKRRDIKGPCILGDGRYPEERKGIMWVFYVYADGWTPKPRGGVDRESVHERWNRTPPETGCIANPAGHPERAADAILNAIGIGRPVVPTHHRIYVAAPYSADNAHDVAANVREAVNITERCIAKGHEAFCPHSHSHAIQMRSVREGRPISYEWWMEFCLTIVKTWATAVVIPTASPGATREEQCGIECGHTIFQSLDEVPDVNGSQRQEDADDTGSTGDREEAGGVGVPAADRGGSSAGSLTEREAGELDRPVRVASQKETP